MLTSISARRNGAAARIREFRNIFAGIPGRNKATRLFMEGLDIPAKPTFDSLMAEVRELVEEIAYRCNHMKENGHLFICGEDDAYMDTTEAIEEHLHAVLDAAIKVRQCEY